MSWIGDWWMRRRRELEQARRENEQARETVATKIKQARERGETVQLFKAALARIATVEQHN